MPDAQEPLASAALGRRRFIAGVAAAFAAGASRAAAPALRVVATTGTLASLASELGGERIAATALVAPHLDVEEYQPRPRDLERLRDADALLRVGVDYDLWLDRLAAQAGNARIARGAPGYVDASVGIALLEVRGAAVGPGHAHGSGNPHYWLDPANAEAVTASLLLAFAQLDPLGARTYEQRRIAFLERLEAGRRRWAAMLAPHQGRAFVAYHNAWAYFARRFRLDVAGVIETKPGVPPAPAHLAALQRTMREKKVALVVREPHEPAKDAEFLARGAGAAVVVLAAGVGVVPDATDYIALLDYDVRTLSEAFARSAR